MQDARQFACRHKLFITTSHPAVFLQCYSLLLYFEQINDDDNDELTKDQRLTIPNSFTGNWELCYIKQHK